MTEKRKPWGKWFWGDWRKDARLRRCSYAARGLWADMLSLMGGECDRFGYLLMEGQALHPTDLAGLLGGSERDIKKMITELEEKRVFSRTGDQDLADDLKIIVDATLPDGVIFSRRMLRDKAKEETDRINGTKGGNPRVKAHTIYNEEEGLPLTLTGGLTPPVKAQSQKPEARTPSLRSGGPPHAGPTTSKPLVKPEKTQGTRWPADAKVPPEWHEDALSACRDAGLPAPDLRLETGKFERYWASKPGAAGRKLNWKKTFTNWIVRAAEDAAKHSKTNGTASHSSFGSGVSARVAARAEGRLSLGDSDTGSGPDNPGIEILHPH